MRDTFIGAVFLAAIVGAFWFFGQSGSNPSPEISVTGAAPTAAPTSSAPAPGASAQISHPPKKHSRKGVIHAHRSKPEPVTQVAVDAREGEASAVEPDQAESLPSLYSGAGAGEAGVDQIDAKPTADSLTKTKNWHGVPVTAWLESRRSALPNPPVTAEAGDNLRFFFQCMELKKDGPQEVAERECRKLRAGLPSDEIARRTGMSGAAY